VITGGSAGVGRATALEFARAGHPVAVLARGLDRLEATREQVEAAGGAVLALPVDVADAGAVDEAASAVEHELGPIGIWVNNAMTTVFSPIAEISAEEFRRATEVTYLGTVHGTLAALRRMRPRNRGTIVQVGSALAYRAIPLQAPYCAAKHAMKGFTESLRCELLHDRSRVRVSMVHLPALNTPQFEWCRTRLPGRPQPVPPIFQPEVAARAIRSAADTAPREIWVGLPTVKAIVGNRVIPGLLDHYLARTAYAGQQTDEPVAEDRPDNLFEPVRGDWRAHGRFDARAKSRSLQEWARRNRGMLLALAGLCAAAAWAPRRLGRLRG
jgi:NAD(P)-dependent dehydrogenase (short-subunit alcohol dehydrogenase family)